MNIIGMFQKNSCPDCGSTSIHLSRTHGHSPWRRLIFQRLHRCEHCDSLFYRFTLEKPHRHHRQPLGASVEKPGSENHAN